VPQDVVHEVDTVLKPIPESLTKLVLKLKPAQLSKEISPKVAISRRVLYAKQNAPTLADIASKSVQETRDIGVHPIELDSATMSCIGFDIGQHSIELLWQGPDQYDRTIRLQEGKGKSPINGTGHRFERRNSSEYVKYGLKPVQFIALSSLGGERPADPNNPISLQSDTTSFDKLLNISIPISFKGQDSSQGFRQCIFWLVPTEELISCLPDSISRPMRKEFRENVKPFLQRLAIKTGQADDFDTTQYASLVDDKANPVSCQYFPGVCEGLPGLADLRVFPIPTSDYLNIEIHLNQSKKITYRIFDIAGHLLNDELPIKDYTVPGQYTEKIDLSGLGSGLYLLILTDEQGARMTKRFIKN
jgi:hypothetical protein